MAATMLCGDEVNAAVVDIGTYCSRFGASGQDSPRHIFRSDIGEWDQPDGTKSRSIGESALRLLRENFEIRSIFSQEDNRKDDIETILRHGLSTTMQVDPSQYALMIAQGRHFRDTKSQQKLAEVCFESLQTPAFFLMPNSVLSGFSAGRPTSLIIDLSASGTTITPIVDGYELKQGIVYSRNGGNTMDIALQQYLEHSFHHPIPTWYDKLRQTTPSSSSSKSTEMIIDGEDGPETIHIPLHNPTIPVYTSSSSSSSLTSSIAPWQRLTPSFQQYHRMLTIQDIKQVYNYIPTFSFPKELQSVENMILNGLTPTPMSSYELPDGTEIFPSYDLCAVADRVYFPNTLSHNGIVGQKRSRTLVQQDRLQQQQQQQQLLLEPLLPMTTVSPKGKGGVGKGKHRSDSMSSIASSAVAGAGVSSSSSAAAASSSICYEEENLSDLIYLSLSRVDMDVRKDLLSHIHLVGGSSLIKGLNIRITKELTEFLPSHFKPKIVPGLSVEKQHAAWIGGSILSICGSFHQCWISKQEYEEYGMDIIKRKCNN